MIAKPQAPSGQAEVSSIPSEAAVTARKQGPHLGGDRLRHAAPWLVAAAAFGPLVVVHLMHLWERPHYQFFPILLGAFAAIIWQRWPEYCAQRRGGRNFVSLILGGISILLLAVAIVGGSPWLGSIAAIIATAGCLVALAGPGTFRAILPAWCLLWLLIPPPLNLDQNLIVAMQRATPALASSLADWLGIDHLRSGILIRMPGHELVVDEACSGVNSLLVIVSLAAVLLVWYRRSWAHALCLFAAAVVWVGLFNSFRLTAIMAAFAWRGWDWSEGTPHTLLGFAVLLPLAAIVWATDFSLFFVFGPIFRAESPLSTWWNRWLADAPPGGPSLASAELPAAPDLKPLPALRGQPMRYLVWSGACGLLAVAQLGLWASTLAQKPATAPTVTRSSTEIAPQLGRETLPAELGRWRQTDYRVEKRGVGDQLGENSQMWVYSSSDQQLIASLDYPFFDWHELPTCYVIAGWRVESREVHAAKSDDPFSASIVEAFLEKPTGERAHLLFTLFDGDGRIVEESLADHLRWRISFGLRELGVGRLPALSRRIYQVQFFTSSDRRLDVQDIVELREHFQKVQANLRKEWKSSGEIAP